jgi:hypothetical protein
MHASLREPILTREPYEVEDAVIAALTAEVIWLCRSGELDQLYRVYPCFTSRTMALDKLMRGERLDALGRKFMGRTVHIVTACHDHGASVVLQVMDRQGRPTPSADALISIRLREGVSPDGKPLPPDGEDV